VYQTRYSLVGS